MRARSEREYPVSSVNFMPSSLLATPYAGPAMTTTRQANHSSDRGIRRRGRGRLTAAFLLATVLAALLIGTGTAFAHAEVIKSDPPNGGLVATMPSQLSLQFSEGIATIQVHVADSAGQRYDAAAASIDTNDHSMAMIPLRTGANGTYTVTWSNLSEDGHTSGGSFFFFVGNSLPDRSPSSGAT
jgi:copper transport protein